MAHVSNARSVAAEFGGKHLQDHRLNFNPPVTFRNSEQRSSVSDESPQKSTNHDDGRGGGQSSTEESTNEDDDEDSSNNQDDQQDEEDDPEVNAPSHGHGLGKGKRPAIRVEPVGDDEPQNDGEEASSSEAGLKSSKHTVNSILMRNKKRTYSDVSNNSVLCGESDDLTTEPPTFPRRKMARKLSNNSAKGLLTYHQHTDSKRTRAFENAFESSGDEDEDAAGPQNTLDIDDEDYSGVNLIPEEDETEDDVEKEEELFLIDEAKHAPVLFSDARRLSLDSTASDNMFMTDIPFNDDFFSQDNFPDVGFGQFFQTEHFSPEPTPSRKYSDSSAKRVRFDDEVQVSDSSSSSASELDNSLWPDLFVEQDKLPPSIYQQIENDNDDNGDIASSDTDVSYWDVGQDEHRHSLPYDSDEFDDDSSDPGSSGYETDLGDTTDEYDSDFASPPPRTPEQKKSVLRRPSSAPGSRAATPRPYQRSERPASGGRFIPPICGSFTHGEGNKAIAVTNKFTGTVVFYRPRTTVAIRRYPNYTTTSSTTTTANNSPRTSIQQLNSEDSDFAEMFNNVAPSADIMLTGVFGGAPSNSSLFNMSAIGPPEAFFPFVDIGPNGATVTDEEYDEDEFTDTDVNIAQFMDFGSDADDTDVEVVEPETETDVPATPATSMLAQNGSTPAQSTPITVTPTHRKHSASDAMLEHFDRGVVSAFRNNQHQYREIARLPPDPDLRASITRPIRSGRTADSVISPLRKRGPTKREFAGVKKASSRLAHGVMGAHRGPRTGTFS